MVNILEKIGKIQGFGIHVVDCYWLSEKIVSGDEQGRNVLHVIVLTGT